jgi:DNA (cytosine-5)-methyltransferase 1
MRPLALDLFCGPGGAAMGLWRAGFDVIGVDNRPQPRYPFPFVQADALNPPFDLSQFDLIWASPPCQAYSSSWTPYSHPDLIPPTRALLAGFGGATVIENVPGAPLRHPLVLDGTMFRDLHVIRRRHFECSFAVPLQLGFDARGLVARGGWSTVVGGGRCSGVPRSANAWHTEAAKRRAMGIDWMRREELAQAIPPAYSEFIDRAALNYIRAEAP